MEVKGCLGQAFLVALCAASLLVAVCSGPGLGTPGAASPTAASPPALQTPTATAMPYPSYRNQRYGFQIRLPSGWQGFEVLMEAWQGTDISGHGQQAGPLVVIRDPRWTEQEPRQDIPIMVFTRDQWAALERAEYAVSAAPMPPSELGSNSRYVFALPARYNYAFPPGWEEVDKLMASKPLSTFEPQVSEGDKALEACGALPNGATVRLRETSRLFINLPKAFYPDRDHNLTFRTVQGDATAGWISNAGRYGEALGAPSAECWSYYFGFDGQGQVELMAKGTVGAPDYRVTFVVTGR